MDQAKGQSVVVHPPIIDEQKTPKNIIRYHKKPQSRGMMDQSNDAVIVMSINSMSLSQVGGITPKLAKPVEAVV